MKKHQASWPLQSAIRKHEENEKEIVNICGNILKAKFHYRFEIKSVEDITKACNSILEHDTFGYNSDPNSENGHLMIEMCNIIKEFRKTRINLISRWNSEKLNLGDNKEKEDRVLAELVSIKNHVAQGFEDVQATRNKEEWRQYLINKGFVYDDGRRVVNNLDFTIAEYVNYVNQTVTSNFIKENFLKSNGSSYGKKACDKARDYANTRN